jgi:hypothetical protein
MSLTDIHFFLPDDFEQWNLKIDEDNICRERYKIEMKSCDYSWAAGDEMIADLKERIPKAMDFRPPRTEHIEKLMDFAQRQAQLTQLGPLSGANLGVKIIKGGDSL